MRLFVLILLTVVVLFSGCNKISLETPENTLITFFQNLTDKKFTQALQLFTTEETVWKSLNIYNPESETSHDDILENYCQATLTCLPATIIGTKKVSDEEYIFSVQFRNADGSVFVLGPCCGATEEEMPSQDTFEYTVKKSNGIFKVVTPPLYVP